MFPDALHYPAFRYLTDKMPGYEGANLGHNEYCRMPNLGPQEIEHLKGMLVEYHSRHAEEYGPIPTCKEPTCVETKLALEYLVARHSPQSDLRGFEHK